MRIHQTKNVKGRWKVLLRLWDFRMPVPSNALLSDQRRATVKSLLKPGDILLESNNAYPLSQIITKVLDGSNWIHAALYVGEDKIIDAGRKPCVARMKLDKFLTTTDVAVYRPKDRGTEDISALITFAKDSLGTPFNLNFDDADGDTFYCTQLISRSLLSMPHPIVLQKKTIFGKTAVPTSAVETNPELECIWSSEPNLARNMKTHWPVLTGAVLGAYGGACISAYGLLPGTVFGAGLSLLIIHKFLRPIRRNHGALGCPT